VLEVLDNPKDITNHSYSPSLILNTVFHSSPGQILIGWYPLLRSILENITAPDIKSSISLRRRMKKMILDSDFVDCMVIYTNMPWVILFWRQKCGNYTGSNFL